MASRHPVPAQNDGKMLGVLVRTLTARGVPLILYEISYKPCISKSPGAPNSPVVSRGSTGDEHHVSKVGNTRSAKHSTSSIFITVWQN